jgi:hypothetical protein
MTRWSEVNFSVKETEDQFAAYEEYRIACGFKARRYHTSDGDMRANRWYFHMGYVAPGKAPAVVGSRAAPQGVNR